MNCRTQFKINFKSFLNFMWYFQITSHMFPVFQHSVLLVQTPCQFIHQGCIGNNITNIENYQENSMVYTCKSNLPHIRFHNIRRGPYTHVDTKHIQDFFVLLLFSVSVGSTEILINLHFQKILIPPCEFSRG